MRGDWFDSTGAALGESFARTCATWDRATLYPGVALMEGTNVSVGRGTDTPFEVGRSAVGRR